MRKSERERFMRAFGKRLYKQRMKAGLSQQKLASICGLGVNAISTYETCTHELGIYAVYRIAAALGCSIEELTGRWE